MFLSSRRSFVALSIAWACQSTWSAGLATAQEAVDPAAPVPLESAAPDAGAPAAPSDNPDAGTGALPSDADAAAAPEDEPEHVAVPVEPPRGDTPVTPEAIVNPEAAQPPAAPEPTPPPPPTEPGPKPKEPKVTKPKEPPPPPEQPAQPPQGPLVVWTTAGWANAFGPAICGPHGLEGSEIAIKIASTLHRSVAVAGFAVAAAGALGDHPLFAYAAKEQPEALADLIAAAGFDALAIGIADVNGPLFREPGLSDELKKRGIAIVANNLECGGQGFCESWQTAEDPLPIVEKNGRRYAFISLLPDDTLGRVQPAGGRRFELHSAADTLVALTTRARQQGAELIVGSIDHGPDASINLANFVSPMPPEVRPDLLLSPSAADNLLFLRPLDVQPAIVGTRPSVLMGLRVTKIADTNDTDVFARSVKLNDRDESFLARARSLGASYCQARAATLAGGHVDTPLSSADLVQLAANALRQRAGTDLAVVDPLAYDATFSQPKPGSLQRGQVERAVQLDSPLVTASVTLDWLANLNKILEGVRPLTLIGTGVDRGDAIIAGRIPVVGARYSIVTTAVLARSGRLPDGASWTLIDEPGATVRGALLEHLTAPSQIDPRDRVRDPATGTQWIFRADGQVQANLTAVDNPARGEGQVYDEPALKVNDSKQLGFRLLLNMDGDAPKFLFENALQIAFDRNFTTNTTAQDLVFLETTYTYRGLWPRPLLYPHPFVEGYLETEFEQGDAPYHHLLVRPEAGFRSMVSRVLSLKLSAGFQYEVLQPDSQIYPGVGAEIVLKPTTVALSNGTVQLEGNIIYYWNAPTELDQHTLRGQIITALTLAGPLQVTLSALGVLRKDKDEPLGKGFSLQAGVRLRFVDRSLNN